MTAQDEIFPQGATTADVIATFDATTISRGGLVGTPAVVQFTYCSVFTYPALQAHDSLCASVCSANDMYE